MTRPKEQTSHRRGAASPQAIHRIGLTPAGEKIAKKMPGPVAGCALKLDADEDVTHGLGIAEGIETALAVRALLELDPHAFDEQHAVHAPPGAAS